MKLAVAFNNRGLAYQARGELDRAIADYTEAIRVDPKYVFAYANRGWAHNEKQAYKSAIVDLNVAIRLNPKYAPARNQRGNAHRGTGAFDLALADYNEAIRLDPKYPRPYGGRGRVHIEKRQYTSAVPDLNEAIRLDPRYAPAFNYRGWAFNELRKYDLALADLNEAVRLDPKYAPSYNNRGNTHRARGDLDRAIADYSDAIRLDPNFVHAYNNRGRTYTYAGKPERAVSDYRRVLELPATTASDRQRQEVAREQISRLTAPIPAPVSSQRRVALVIGNSKYASVGPLANPRNDARAVAAALRRLGFAEVMEFHDLDQSRMGRALKDFGDRAVGAEWAVVFFAGHGIELNGTNYLIPIDAELKSDTHVGDETLSLDRVQAKVQAAGKFGLVILDACRSNPFLSRMARTGRAGRSVGRGLADTEPEGNMLVAYSAKHGTVAEDGVGKHSPFTQALLAHLEEPGLEINLLFRRI